MQTQLSDSTTRSTGSAEWTPERLPPTLIFGKPTAWTLERIERMRRQDQASARVRKALGQIVPKPGLWLSSLKAKG